MCSNVVPSLNRLKHYVFLWLLSVLRVVIWTTRQKAFREGEYFLQAPNQGQNPVREKETLFAGV